MAPGIDGWKHYSRFSRSSLFLDPNLFGAISISSGWGSLEPRVFIPLWQLLFIRLLANEGLKNGRTEREPAYHASEVLPVITHVARALS